MEERELGIYRLLREVGHGGMGTVYEARNLLENKKVALKCLNPGRARSERAMGRFRREVAALLRVRHPVLVPVLDADLEGETPYLVMPFVEGRSLLELIFGLRHGCQDTRSFLARAVPELEGCAPDSIHKDSEGWIRFVVRAGQDLAQALAAAHGAGLIHRDLKPGNVMVGEDGALSLLDFGLVRDEQALSFTLTEERVGTPLYMSPEQVSRDGQADARSDLYALGMTLREALTLRPPFDRDDLASLYHAILREDPAPLARGNPAAPRDLRQVLDVCARKSPRDRYQDAATLARDLGLVLVGRPPRPPQPTWWRRCQRFTLKHGRRVAIASLLVATVGSLAWALTRRGPGVLSDGPMAQQRLDEGRRRLDDADYTGALQLFRAVLLLRPADEEALDGIRRVVRLLSQRAEHLQGSFRYGEAARDLRAVQGVAPEEVPSLELQRLESIPYVTLAALARRLLEEQVTTVERCRALEELGRKGSELELPSAERERLLLKILGGPDRGTEVLATALRVAGVIKARQAAGPARELLASSRAGEAVRVAAAGLLGELRARDSREILEKVALERGPVGDRALSSLGQLGAVESVPLLLRILREDGGERARLAAAAVMGIPGRQLRALHGEMEPILVTLFRQTADLELKAGLLSVFGHLSGPASVGLLVEVLKDPSPRLREAAADSLRGEASQNAQEGLIQVLTDDRFSGVRKAATLSLGTRTGPAVAALVKAAREDPDGEVRARALVALGEGRVQAVLGPALQILQESQDLRARAGAILSLGLLQSPDSGAVDQLTVLLRRGSHPDERLAAAWALGQLQEPGALPVLISVLREEAARFEASVRAEAALRRAGSGLFLILGDRRMREMGALLGLLPRVSRDLSLPPDLAEAVVLAMGAMIPEAAPVPARDAVQTLLVVARSARRPSLRAAAVGALGRLPDRQRESVPVLEEILSGEGRREVRRALSLALTRLGRPAAGEALLTEPARDGEDALVRALILLRLGRERDSRPHLQAAFRLGILDSTRMSLEPELAPLRFLASWLGLTR